MFVIKNPGDNGKVVEQRFVELGQTKGDYVSILSGITAGEEIVTTGAFKLSNNIRVVVDNSRGLSPSSNRSQLIRRGDAAMSESSKAITDIFVRRPVLAIVVNLVIIIADGRRFSMRPRIRRIYGTQYQKRECACNDCDSVFWGGIRVGSCDDAMERAIASADGIDYIESSSIQGLSTISIRLKLNVDATKALAEISSKVDQVRGDLPRNRVTHNKY